jgi:hypothetical protein
VTRRLLAAVVLAAVVCPPLGGCGTDAASGPAPAMLPRDFVGISTEDAFARPGHYRRTQLRRQARAGIGVVRQTFAWNAIELQPGRYRFARYDRFVLDVARAGMRVLPILFDPPAFRARALPRGVQRATAPPRDPQTMAHFATLLVRRYGPDGTLWRAHPEIPAKPITSWQVWNEPNLGVYWRGRPSAAEYTDLLRVVGQAIHDADPRAEVLTAGLPQSKLGVPFEDYLRAMYAAGAQHTFDVLAINAYSRTVAGMQAAIVGARRITASAQDGDVPIWVTEFGWATRPGPGSKMTVKRSTQARLLGTAIPDLAAQRERLGLRGLVYYGWRDARPYPGGTDFWGLHTGLLDRAGRAKPALQSFAAGIRLARDGRR